MRKLRFPIVLSILGLAALAALTLAACQGREKTGAPAVPAPAAEKTVNTSSEELNTEALSAVLGKAEAENSGVFDVAKGENELVVTYHFYEARKRGLEDRLGPDMAPKIQALYRKFKTIDRVLFKVDIFERRDDIVWRPYCSFVTTRKLIDETNWTSLLLKEFFKVVLELKYAE
jgi:hypothetical protein